MIKLPPWYDSIDLELDNYPYVVRITACFSGTSIEDVSYTCSATADGHSVCSCMAGDEWFDVSSYMSHRGHVWQPRAMHRRSSIPRLCNQRVQSHEGLVTCL